MNTTVHKEHYVHAASIGIFFFSCCLLDFILFMRHQILKFLRCNLSLNEKIMFPFNILLSRLMRNIILVLVLCTSFKFDRHSARSRPLLLSLIFLACLLTFSFVALTVSHLDVRNHESDAKTGQYRTLCPNLR